jgi:hypothetical protein
MKSFQEGEKSEIKFSNKSLRVVQQKVSIFPSITRKLNDNAKISTFVNFRCLLLLKKFFPDDLVNDLL